MCSNKVAGCDIFCIAENFAAAYVSARFKMAVELAKLKGFDFRREVPLIDAS